MTPIRPATAALALSAALLCAGCTVGPEFREPPAPEVAGYTPEPLGSETASAAVAGGAAQRFRIGQDIPGQWWTLFRAPALNRLVEQALAVNPDLMAAQAALRQSREAVLVQEGGLLPKVDASLSPSRQEAAGAEQGRPGLSQVFSLTTATLSVSYLFDAFGGTQRGIEAAEAAAEAQRHQLEAAYLTLTANVVVAAVQEAGLRAQIAATNEIIAAEAAQLQVMERQFTLGGASRADSLAQASTLAQTRATLPVLQKQLDQQRNLLTALAGRYPSQQIEQTFELASLELPEELPVSLPSQLVAQRPDVRSAAATLHQASAQIGVAEAAKLPQFSLSATFGRAAGNPLDLFAPGGQLWSVGAGLAQPLFHGGQLEHQRLAAVAAYDRAEAQYRGVVLNAFRNVADALRALQADAAALQAQLAAERSAADSLGLSNEQYRAGAISYLTLLNAERTYEQAHILLVQAQATRFADTAALFQALGGGWWNRTDTASPEPTEMKFP